VASLPSGSTGRVIVPVLVRFRDLPAHVGELKDGALEAALWEL